MSRFSIVVNVDDEKRSETEYPDLGAAIEAYEKYVDHGFAREFRVVSIIDSALNNMPVATKRFEVPGIALRLLLTRPDESA